MDQIELGKWFENQKKELNVIRRQLSAFPDLLGAAKEGLEIAEDYVEELSIGHIERLDLREKIKRIKAAIEKAEGSSNYFGD